MRLRVMLLAFVIVSLPVALFAAVGLQHPSGIERLSNGNTVICDCIAMDQPTAGNLPTDSIKPTARVVEIDSSEHLVWAYVRGDIPWAHTARRNDNGNTLITATQTNRVMEVTSRGQVVWQMNTGLDYPNEAYRLANGHTLITDRNNNRCIEVDSAGHIVWSYTNLTLPHNGNRLANGNTLICDSEGTPNRVVEVTPGGSVVWQYSTGLSWPRCCQRLPDGHTLITSSRNNRVIEVDSTGNVVWSFASGLSQPYQATRLANGNTIISTDARVIEVDSARNIVWQYPPVSALADEFWVVNPTSGESLYVHIHRPLGAGPSNPVPGIVLVPDALGAGTVFDDNGMADSIATDGFAVLHFDAEGRGRSGGTEDYNGYVHQDGLAECAAVLQSLPYVDSENIGIYSRGYGVVMATGMIARHASSPVKFLLDFEGPADRYQSSRDFGGPVPYPVDSEAFWQQREAARFIKSVPGAYLRIQTATDHTGLIPGNRHAIALIDSSTATEYGGSGISVWTRVNDSVMNPENQIYSPSDPPAWIPEVEESSMICREILYLHELTDSSFHVAVSFRPSSLASRPSPFAVLPNPCRGVLQVELPAVTGPRELQVHDVCGRLVARASVPSSIPQAAIDLRHLQPGVYYVSAAGAGTVPVVVVR
jgi:hypothetical protein